MTYMIMGIRKTCDRKNGWCTRISKRVPPPEKTDTYDVEIILIAAHILFE